MSAMSNDMPNLVIDRWLAGDDAVDLKEVATAAEIAGLLEFVRARSTYKNGEIVTPAYYVARKLSATPAANDVEIAKARARYENAEAILSDKNDYISKCDKAITPLMQDLVFQISRAEDAETRVRELDALIQRIEEKTRGNLGPPERIVQFVKDQVNAVTKGHGND